MSTKIPASRREPWRRVLTVVLLAAPFVGVLCVPVYGSAEPRLAGLPFFYAYQLLWVLLTPLLMFFAYRLSRRAPDHDADETTQEGSG